MSLQINEVKALMTQFDGSTLRDFSYATSEFNLSFSKNTGSQVASAAPTTVASAPAIAPEVSQAQVTESVVAATETVASEAAPEVAEGEVVTSPLVGVAYLKPAPDKSDFISVGDSVKKGQTLLIIEAMKVMNEIPAPKDGVVTEIIVSPEAMVEYGEELVRIK
ncbi:acetyl-CoA carboxylase biotin carboxyl carrier protein [Pseudolactococcus plantarum]|uniref:Biotin carboxyl carrier protein of acetyl-CoA carboxylase n=1 Tax=Pseudolactococcus plantarum TaxID=1365 RepID=A0A2A5S121_9LACT|nr:acetyl-CoA carboxylase biotin carboxyl carrier protein [Lactococcus plantarum]PCS07165.1 acetyl-CoA carboxylase biotin carboxyl carrier protein subunit [Lactococcus plantarum]HCN74895.1 acetyl-CoA carboxylase biotin carboxyl carrier protein [Lactococcus sp.]